MDERRRYVRLDTRLKISYTIIKKNGALSKKSETKDISGGGIRIFLEELLPAQTLIKLTIQLPENPQAIQCTGRVVWVESFSVLREEMREKERYEAGIQFTEIREKDRDRIIKYVILGYAAAKK